MSYSVSVGGASWCVGIKIFNNLKDFPDLALDCSQS